MNTYIIRNNPGGPSRKVRAKDIDNLRKNLVAKMNLRDKKFVYTANDEYIGGLMRLGKNAVGWPEFMWFAYGMDYMVDPRTGGIKRY